MNEKPRSCAWVDGRFVPASSVPITDRGFLWGEGLFETLRVVGGSPFRLAAHLARLQASAVALELPLPAGDWTAGVADALDRLVSDLVEGAGRVRLTLTAGDAARSGDPADPPQGPARLFLAVTPYAGPPVALVREGAAAALPVGGRGAAPDLAGETGDAGHKTIGYLPHLRVLRAARAAGFDEGLRGTAAGQIVGGSRANLFLVAGGRLVTPAVGTGCLPGITRAVVLAELAEEVGLPAGEAPIGPAELDRAEEAFLTNSLWGILPLARLGDRALASAAPGSVTRSLVCSYESLLATECGAP